MFALVVCLRSGERGPEMLLVDEVASMGFWLPGGRVDPGEDFATAAVRETREEAGVAVRLTGVLAIEHTPRDTHDRMRVVFSAEIDEPAGSNPVSSAAARDTTVGPTATAAGALPTAGAAAAGNHTSAAAAAAAAAGNHNLAAAAAAAAGNHNSAGNHTSAVDSTTSSAPKTVPDEETVGACWVPLPDIRGLPLRGREPLDWARRLEAGATAAPLGILGPERRSSGGRP
jgi:ADP-ribose pyrophosphatase YjhB (NUDIX family)